MCGLGVPSGDNGANLLPCIFPERLGRPKNRHYSLATYVLLRGITLLIRTGNTQRAQQRHPWLHAVLAPTRFRHGDTALMCAACSQIIYAFIMMPQTLPTSYVRFIRKQGAKDLYVWQGIRVSSLLQLVSCSTQIFVALEPLTALLHLTSRSHQVCNSVVGCASLSKLSPT